MPDSTSPPGAPFGGDDLSAMRLQLDALTDSQLQLNVALQNGDRIGRQFGRTLSNALVGLAVQGKSFGDVLGSLATSLSKIAAGAAFKPLESAFGNALQSLVSSPSLISNGGIAAPSALSIGSSLFGGSGLTSMLGGGSGGVASPGSSIANNANIVFNVTTPSAESFYSSETQIAALLARAVAQGQRNL
jgi:hypothetical protein